MQGHDRSIRIVISVISLIIFAFPKMAFSVEDINLKWNDLNMGGSSGMMEAMPHYPHRANTHSDVVINKDDFMDAATCGSCHTEIYQQWKNSMMAYSWDDPIYRAVLKLASEATDGAVDSFCTGCHTPIGLTSNQISSEFNRTPIDQEEHRLPGVDCESCHNMSGRTGIDNGAYQLSLQKNQRPIKLGPRADAVSPFHDTAYSEFHTRSDFCGTCHNVTHPFNNVPIERTYDEWLESSYAKEGIDCQSCHMKTYEGKAAIMGPERPNVVSHAFTGGNSTVLSHLGSEYAADMARKFLQSAAEIEFYKFSGELKTGGNNRITVKVKNVGAGHKLPTGFPEGREIWVDFSITDRFGSEVYRLGKIQNGKTEPNTRNFKVHLGDKNGDEVDIAVWDVTHIISDNRILPKGYGLAEFDVYLPKETEGPFTLNATLNYWAFPQALVDYLLGEGAMKVDVVKMTEINMVVPGDGD